MADVNVKIKGLDKLEKDLKDFFEKEISTPKLLDEIKNFVIDRIQAFARSGKSLVGGSPNRFKPLSKSYLDVRRGAVKFRIINGKVIPFAEPDERLNDVDSQYFDPNLSQITFTGQMLRALKGFIDPAKKSVRIFIEDSKRHGKYEKLTNAEVAGHVKDNGRPFLGLDDKGQDRVRKLVLDQVRRSIKLKFKK